MATVFRPRGVKTVRVLQSRLSPAMDPGFRPKAWDQRLRHGSGAR